ncbi:fungal-specific transcription factor domain protein [Rhizoctonia solani AG-3 Rhs1AP]|uniref:Fungal-specific transcription factor domain protein n=1 Tax=Rhizoctonia solani AG-3 Rhs1AP TaxID=1086054 RepID=X8JC13_9AGAM|nr:fungal-specific transcription factor domain protein [Rhizoctonia solani AG-3 Rhs1AP]
MEYKKTRGPATKSCLTCKRRHKKCDLKRPKCDRCIKGGYECAYGPPEKPRVRVKKAETTESVSNNLTYPAVSSDVSDQSTPSCSSGSPDMTCDAATMESICNTEPIYDTFPPSHQLVLARPQSVANLDVRISPGLSHLSSDSWRMISYLMTHFDRVLNFTYFKPLHQQLVKYRETMLVRLQTSSITRRIKLISFKLYEAIAKGDEWRYQTIFTQWLNQFETELCSIWKSSVVPQAKQIRLLEALEISYLKTMLLSNENSYPFLRFTTPTFLQTVYSDPTLWPPNHDSSSIPMAHILSSSRCELGNFVIIDTLYSMAYNLPQLVEYDTSITFAPNELYSHSWTHGCPTEFQIALSEINTCRDGKATSTGRDWRAIEQSLLTWESRPIPQEAEWESWMVVAWLAVQESWRHALLAYLYMALCGAPSDDPRVQASVKQILRIVKTVKKPKRPVVSVHFLHSISSPEYAHAPKRNERSYGTS